MELTSTDDPPILAFYMTGNASGAGFGSALIGDDGPLYKAGTWSGDWHAESSNFRETDNLVTRVVLIVLDGVIMGHELFMFTDNLVFDMGYYNSTRLQRNCPTYSSGLKRPRETAGSRST